MKTFIKRTTAAALTTIGGLSMATSAWGDQLSTLNLCENLPESMKAACQKGGSDIGQIVANLIFLLFGIATIIAVVFLIWGGVKWILSGGDKGKVEAARSTIIAAVIGLVIVFVSFFLINIVLALFGMNLSQIMELPTLW